MPAKRKTENSSHKQFKRLGVLAKNKLHLPYWQDELDNLEDYPECTIPIAFRLANLASLCPQYEQPPKKTNGRYSQVILKSNWKCISESN